MNSLIVDGLDPITLIGAGESRLEELELALKYAPVLVAADAGAQSALHFGHRPKVVIGDLDSLSAAAKKELGASRLHHICEQDSTDFDKALRSIAAPFILAVGFLGGRIDHQLAVMNTLVRRSQKPCIVVGEHEVIFHVPRVLDLELHEGDVVSLFPMAEVSGRSTGLEWPIDGLRLRPDGIIGTSNRAVGSVRIETDGPGLLIIVPKNRLPEVMRAIAQGQ
ncbi:MAG: thiamine diphosphokinase [Paracoccaceae bacterium]